MKFSTFRILLPISFALFALVRCSCGDEDLRALRPEEDDASIPILGTENPDEFTDSEERPNNNTNGNALPEESTEPTSISGRFCLPNEGGPIANANVTLAPIDALEDVVATTTTDNEGAFSFDALEPGTYRLVASRGSFQSSQTLNLLEGENLDLGSNASCLTTEVPNIIVIESARNPYDGVYPLLEAMALDENTTRVEIDELDDLLALGDRDFFEGTDIIFFSCGQAMDGVDYMYDDDAGALADQLRSWRVQGISLHFSDWAYSLLELGFPDMVDWLGDDSRFFEPLEADVQSLTARIVSPSLTSELGRDELELVYDLPQVAVIDSVDANVEVLLRASVYAREEYELASSFEDSPIAFRRKSNDKGTIIFTSAHHKESSEQSLLSQRGDFLRALVLDL